MGQRCPCAVHNEDLAKAQLIQASKSVGESREKSEKPLRTDMPASPAAVTEKRHKASKGGGVTAGQAPDFDVQSEGGQSHGSRSNASRVSSNASSGAYREMSKEQQQEAKRVIKEFVRMMVKGKKMEVMLPDGRLKGCFISLSRQLDALKIRASEKDKQERRVPLSSIVEILGGADLSQSHACEGLQTPLDDLSVTLALSGEECITFRMHDADERDTFLMCVTMFSNEALAKAEG